MLLLLEDQMDAFRNVISGGNREPKGTPHMWKDSGSTATTKDLKDMCVVVLLTLQVHMCVQKTDGPWKLIEILVAVPDVVSFLEQINLSLGALYAGIHLRNFFLPILSYNDH